MERMTGEYKGRYGIKTPEGFMPAYEMASSNKSAESIAAFQEGIDRLAAYEDLGVTPDQIRQIDGLCSEPAKEMGRMAKTRMCRGKYWTGGSSGHYEEFESGIFHQWGSNYEEFDNGAGKYSTAIVELPDGKVVMPNAGDIEFTGTMEDKIYGNEKRSHSSKTEDLSIDRAMLILDPEYRGRYSDIKTVYKARLMGQEALNRRIARSPYPDGDRDVLYCASCGSGEYLHNEDGNQNLFCGQCGQAIDWSDDNE